MALVTKNYLTEQVRSLLAGGSPSAGAKYEPRMIASHLQSAINRRLKAEYFSATLPNEETIPEGLILATYDKVPVEKYKGLSRAKLPAMPVSLRRGMGVYFVGPHITADNLSTPEVTATINGNGRIDLAWGIIANATTYRVERAIDSLFTTGLTDIYLGDAISFSDTGLTQSTTYYYRVTAKADGYSDSLKGTASATTQVNVFRLLINSTDSFLINSTDKLNI